MASMGLVIFQELPFQNIVTVPTLLGVAGYPTSINVANLVNG